MSAGKVVILDENGQERALTYAQFAQLLDNDPFIRLCILRTCGLPPEQEAEIQNWRIDNWRIS